jgi:hypothetical protein
MALLPEFSFEQPVSAEGGKHDKITLHVRHRIYRGAREDIGDFRYFLGSMPADAGSGEYHGGIFNRAGEIGTFWKPLTIRSSRAGRTLDAPLPLFRGEYAFLAPRMESAQDLFVQTVLRLNLNPTRFLRYQDPGYMSPRPGSVGTRATFYQSASITEGNESSLDRTDNWIPDLPELQRLHDNSSWPQHIRNYLEGVMREIDQETERVARSPEVQVRFQEITTSDRFSLKEVETYFEFVVPAGTSIDRVRSFEPLLQSFNELNVAAKDYPIEGWDENSRVLTVPIRFGVKLKIYAKTKKRIRFEVVHELRHARFPVSGTISRTRTRHTAPTLRGIYAMLDRLRADTADIVNSVIRHMRDQTTAPATAKTAVDLLFAITRASDDPETARTLVSILLHKGSITSQAQLRCALRKLWRARVVRAQNQNRRREYIVTEQYQYPLEMLRQHGA